MKILIIGDGKVGYAIAEQLSVEEHDVTIVDNNAHALSKAVAKLDVLCINGSGSSIATLKEADIEKQDLVILVTSSDEINMVCALLAHKLSNAHIIARIRNPEYAESESFIKDVLGIDICINPELSAANEISRLLRFPQAHSMESFFLGKVEIIEFLLTADAPILNAPLSQVAPKIPAHILISSVQRNDEIFIADGATELLAGDHIFVVGVPQEQLAFSRYLKQSKQKVRNVMIVGGSRIAYYLASQIQRMGMHVRIIEIDGQRCEKLYELLPNVLIINADGTEHDVLQHEGIEDMDAFVALTDRDEENIIAGMYALDVKVPKVIVKITRMYYTRLAQGMSTISPKNLTADRIVRFVRSIVNSEGNFVERLYHIAHGEAEAMEFTVGPGSRVVQVPLKNLRLKKGVLVAAIMHKSRVIIPRGGDMIREGDHVIIVTNGEYNFLDVNDILIGG
ncbi:MAG: Trk system potassium transporter TrkA [Clostridiales bacterium]|jgi:trk system potassium uptake protein TrkA|nr:Trk system potassium transporter TrkA [Clostridiales bacterium]